MSRSRSAVFSVLAASMLPLVAGCIAYRGDAVRGSGNIELEERAAEPFESIDLRGAPDVEVTFSDFPSIVVEADDNVLPLVETVARDGRLIISTRGSYSSRHGVRIRVATRSLESLKLAGSGSVEIDGLRAGRFEVALYGSGDVVASGEAGEVVATIKGSGDIDLSALSAKSARASIAGSGDIDLLVVESLDASITGSGDITYRGDPPQISRRVVGSGEISRR